jgi:hypothetical protein
MANFDELYDVVMEANAYNKWANKLKNEYDDHMKSYHDNQDKIINNNKSIFDPRSKVWGYAADAKKHFNAAYDIEDQYRSQTGEKEMNYSPHGDERSVYQSSVPKQTWMKKHGNVGKSPEERYKPNRYLNIQQKINGTKESANDIRLEIYESCRYGEISEEERDLLLEMI